MITPTTARRANAQIRRLRAALLEARESLCDYLGPDGASVKACDEALAGGVPHEQRQISKIFEDDRRRARLQIDVDLQSEALSKLELEPVERNRFKCTCFSNQLGPHYCERHDG